MFDRIRKLFSSQPIDSRQYMDSLGPMSVSDSGYSPLSQWAATQGFEFMPQGVQQAFAVTGEVGGKAWRLELGAPSRSYVVGEELRVRADLATTDEVAVMVISRPLRDRLQAMADPRGVYLAGTPVDMGSGEEFELLARYPEVRWEGLPEPFWSRFAVVAQRPGDAAVWLDTEIVRQLLAWPAWGVPSEVPFLMLLHRGKLTLRMEYFPADLPTLQHAAGIFTNACESALSVFPASGVLPVAAHGRHGTGTSVDVIPRPGVH